MILPVLPFGLGPRAARRRSRTLREVINVLLKSGHKLTVNLCGGKAVRVFRLGSPSWRDQGTRPNP